MRVIDPGGKRAQSAVLDRRVREGMGSPGFVLSLGSRVAGFTFFSSISAPEVLPAS